jgi:acyl-ACP thioesterase
MTDSKTTPLYHTSADAFHCDFLKKMCIGHLGNDLLNASDMHSTERGFGMTYLWTQNKTWVLSRLAIELEDIPQEHEHFFIETWVESAMKFFTKRNWAICSEDGKKTYGYAKSIWAMIDTNTREPQDILAVNEGKIKDYLYPEKECPIKDVSRVKTPEMTEYTDFRVLYGDLDVNGHLNSMRYIDHVLNTFSLEFFLSNQLHRIEIAYVAEGHWGDTVRIYYTEGENNRFYFRLVRQQNDEDTELARVLIDFQKI